MCDAISTFSLSVCLSVCISLPVSFRCFCCCFYCRHVSLNIKHIKNYETLVNTYEKLWKTYVKDRRRLFFSSKKAPGGRSCVAPWPRRRLLRHRRPRSQWRLHRWAHVPGIYIYIYVSIAFLGFSNFFQIFCGHRRCSRGHAVSAAEAIAAEAPAAAAAAKIVKRTLPSGVSVHFSVRFLAATWSKEKGGNELGCDRESPCFAAPQEKRWTQHSDQSSSANGASE